MKTIPKADTFGSKREWQVDPAFIKELCHQLKVEGLYEELLDDTLVALVKEGYLEWAPRGN